MENTKVNACCVAKPPHPIVKRNGQLYVKLNSGYEMPMIGLGTFQVEKPEPEKLRQVIRNAVQVGYKLIDCAHMYENEDVIGQELDALINKEGILKREDIFITSKLHPTYMGRDEVVPILKKQLKNLKVEYLDLYLIHWPMPFKRYPDDRLWPINSETKTMEMDYSKHYTETWKGMEEAVRLGLVRSIGISNFNERQIENILLRCSIRPSVLEIESHPHLNNRKLIEWCQNRDIQVTAYSPFANPKQNITHSEEYPAPLYDEKVKAIADKYPGKSTGHILLRWQLQRGVSTIPKTIRCERLKSNLNVFDFELSDEDIEVINSLDRGLRMVSFAFYKIASSRDYPFDDYRDVNDDSKCTYNV